MRSWLPRLAGLVLLTGCTSPHPADYAGGSPTGGAAISLGKNASGENCNQLPGDTRDSVAVFCGTWQQPAARVRTDGASADATPMSIATSSSWRETIDLRFACDAPVVTSILGGEPAVV